MSARLETEASLLARARGHAPAVRKLSESLLENRHGVDPDLLHLLHGRAMALPMMDNDQRKALTRLARLNGSRFDRQYLDLVGPEQQRLVLQQYERALAETTDPALRGWIERQLPALRQRADDGSRVQLVGDARKPRPDGVVRSASWPPGRAMAR